MFRQTLFKFVMVFSIVTLTACGSAPYSPVASQADPIDTLAYAPKVDNFIVLLDTSGSMTNDEKGRPRIYDAQDWVASFNGAVPPFDYKAGLITYGKGSSGTCVGYGVASTIYGLSPYNAADFGSALNTIECAASTTPIAEAIDSATGLLTEETGLTAVIIVSDFNWNDPAAVEKSLAKLKRAHPNNICLHTVKVGNDTSHDAMISSLTSTSGCDSAVRAEDYASGAVLSTYVAQTLLTPLEKAIEYETHTVSAQTLFDFDKAILKDEGKVELHRLAGLIKGETMTVRDIDVVGHTDSVGTDEYNQRLSIRRAAAVKSYMASQGIPGSIIDVIGMGERQPVASNETAEGRALNRRVDILVGTTRRPN